MAIPSSEDILSMDTDGIVGLIQEQTSAKTLSALIRQLNTELLAGDEAIRDLASRALTHLGFVDGA